MLLLGTFLIEREPYAGTRWRLGIQWLGSHAWFWERLNDGSWVKSSYHWDGLPYTPGSGGDGGRDGDELGGVREPRRPRSPTGSAAIAAKPPS